MDKRLLVGLCVVGGIASATAVGYGGWYAWDSGLIPGNPRAPTLAVIEPVVRRAVQQRHQQQPAPCFGADARAPRPEVQGRPGIAYRGYPGQHAMTYLIEGAPQTQDSRERLLQQYSFLVKQGFYIEADVSIETDAGPRSAKEFVLTWKGFAALEQESATPCFVAGSRQFERVEKLARIPGEALGMELWEVSFRSAVSGIPEWAQAPQARTLFPRYGEAAASRTERLRLVRGKEGWLTEREMQIEMQLAQRLSSGQETAALAARMARAARQSAPPPDEATLRKAFDDYLASEQWQSRSMAACMPLALQRGGDQRGPQASIDRSVFHATWYDAPENVRPQYQRNAMLTQLHILAALEMAGLATLEKAGPGTVGNQPVASGIKFVVKPEALESLGLAGGGCAPVGRVTKVELLGFVATSGAGVRVAARGEIGLVQPWARTLAEHLPALKVLLEEGVPYTGQLQFGDGFDRSAMQGEPRWRVVSLQAVYPQIISTVVPPRLAAYLPATHAAVKPVKAPASLPGLPVVVPPAPPPAPSAGQPQALAPAPAAPVQQPRKVPHPAGVAEVHVISVYEGELPAGTAPGSRQDPERSVDVVVARTAKPVLLFLSAYEPIEWRVKVEGGTLERVIAIGYHDQRVTVTGARGVPILTQRSHEFFSAAGVAVRDGFPREARGNKAVEVAEIMTALTGKLPTSFQGAYRGGKVFRVDAASPPVVLPQPTSVASAGAGKVILQGQWREATDELTVRYAGAGAYTEAWASRAYSSGKVYFEAALSVEGGGSAKPHANVGVAELEPRGGMASSSSGQTPAIAHGEQSVYRHGDVFGVAVDYDAGLMHVRVNGQWITGEPGSGQGKRFRTGRERAAYLFATGGGRSGGDQQGSVSWQVNFGASPFRDRLPKGFVSYDGTQR